MSEAPLTLAVDNSPELANLQKDAADLRRDQLVDIASRLIEAEGLDAVKHTRIAKLAGCTRSLVYHYFPKRSDVFAGVNARFYQRLDAMIPVDAQLDALRENLDGKKANSLALFATLFDLIEDGGWSSLILQSTPELNQGFRSDQNSIHDAYAKRWIDLIAERFDMSGVDSELFYQHSISITKTIYLFYRKGMLSKLEAVEKMDVALNQLLNPYR